MKSLLIIIIFVSYAIVAFAQSKAVIRLADETTIDGNQILLRDIAQISTNEEKAKKLREISLGYSPNIGMSREIFRDRIMLAIIAAGFSNSDFTLQSSAKITIHRSSQTVDQDLIREAVERSVQSNFQTDKVEVKITKLQLPERIELPKGKVEVIAATMSGVRNFLAPFTVLLEIKVDDKTIRRSSASVEIQTFAEVLVMNKTLAGNERITASDVHKEKVLLEKPLSYYSVESDNLYGKKLLKNVSADEPVLLSSITPDSVIRVGDLIKIIGQTGKMQIIVMGEARANGRIGDRIPVKNSQSGAILQATVVDEGLVKITF